MRTRHRLFLAINLPENTKEELAIKQSKWKSLFPKTSLGGFPIKWVEKQNLHITLNFLGYLFDERVDQIVEIFKKANPEQGPFSIRLNRICYAPSFKKPTMIWVMAEKSEEFTKLKQNLDKILTELKIGLENREFTSHITLGRIKQWEFRKISLEDRPLINEKIYLDFMVNSVDLMESKLKRTGPEYTILKKFSLSSR